MLICESCNENYATTRSTNPDWSGYELCAECATEYDDRPPVGMEVRGVFHYDGTPDEDEWDEPMIIPRDSLPSQRIITLADVGGICWPDAVDIAVATQTGAINSNSLQRIEVVE